jgi:Cysteine-rich CPCC
MTEGANHVGLIEAQGNFLRNGACEPALISHVRPPMESDVRDPEWRPIDEGRDNIETPDDGVDCGQTYPSDYTRLYYWRDTYWRR